MTPRPRQHSAPTSGYAVAYLRVSTDEQRESGLGLEAQTATVEQAAKRAGLTIRATFTDAGVSGALPIDKRPQLAAALAALKRGDVLLVAKRDRLGRDVVNVAMIESAARRKGARVISAAGEGTEADPSDPTAVLMRSMVDAFAQYERLLIGARTAAALKAKRLRGERYGELPYGYRVGADGRRLELHADEHQMIARAVDMRAAGVRWQAIADALNVAGYTNRKGRQWSLHNLRAAVLTYQRHEAERVCTEGRPSRVA